MLTEKTLPESFALFRFDKRKRVPGNDTAELGFEASEPFTVSFPFEDFPEFTAKKSERILLRLCKLLKESKHRTLAPTDTAGTRSW